MEEVPREQQDQGSEKRRTSDYRQRRRQRRAFGKFRELGWLHLSHLARRPALDGQMDGPLGDPAANFFGIIELILGELQFERLVTMPDLFTALDFNFSAEGRSEFLLARQIGLRVIQRDDGEIGSRPCLDLSVGNADRLIGFVP